MDIDPTSTGASQALWQLEPDHTVPGCSHEGVQGTGSGGLIFHSVELHRWEHFEMGPERPVDSAFLRGGMRDWAVACVGSNLPGSSPVFLGCDWFDGGTGPFGLMASSTCLFGYDCVSRREVPKKASLVHSHC